jgi:hypothetical protein
MGGCSRELAVIAAERYIPCDCLANWMDFSCNGVRVVDNDDAKSCWITPHLVQTIARS